MSYFSSFKKQTNKNGTQQLLGNIPQADGTSQTNVITAPTTKPTPPPISVPVGENQGDRGRVGRGGGGGGEEAGMGGWVAGGGAALL